MLVSDSCRNSAGSCQGIACVRKTDQLISRAGRIHPAPAQRPKPPALLRRFALKLQPELYASRKPTSGLALRLTRPPLASAALQGCDFDKGAETLQGRKRKFSLTSVLSHKNPARDRCLWLGYGSCSRILFCSLTEPTVAYNYNSMSVAQAKSSSLQTDHSRSLQYTPARFGAG